MKRFTETTKWGDPWFMDLPVKYKTFWFYILDQCDCAGTWEPNMRLAVAQIGEPLELVEILRVFAGRIEQIKDGKLWVKKFIEFQYGVLSPDCKPHIPVIKRLDYLGLSKGYPKGIHTLKEKEKDKEKDKKEGTREKQAEEIYQAYPLKKAKPEAIRAILNALGRAPFDLLLSQTNAFAKARGDDLAFVPNPSTWFNQDRFKDDPETWVSSQSREKKKPKPWDKIPQQKLSFSKLYPT